MGRGDNLSPNWQLVITPRVNRLDRRNAREERVDIEMEKFPIDVANSTSHCERIHLGIMNFLSNFTDIETIDKLPPRRFRGAIQIVISLVGDGS